MHTADSTTTASPWEIIETPGEILTNDFNFDEPDKKVKSAPYVPRTSPLAEGEIITLKMEDFLQARDYPDRARTRPPVLSMERGFMTLDDWAPMVDLISTEITFDCLEQAQNLPSYGELQAHGEAIGREGMRCPLCDGGSHIPLLHKGRDTGLLIRIRRWGCPCGMLKNLWRELGNVANIPARFQGVKLEGMLPSGLSILPIERQQTIISFLQSCPDDSYFLFGPPQTGKTHMMTALYRHGVEKWAPQVTRQFDGQSACWRIRTATLLDQHVKWATRGNHEDGPPTPCPLVTVEKIQAAITKGYTPRLFLDEIDKIGVTPFKLNALIALVDAVYEGMGQVVASSNVGVEGLSGVWGINEAGTILRRIAAGPGAHQIQFA